MSTVIVVGGPAGTGKSTIADILSTHFKCPFIEGDTLHPQNNIEKMSKGIPLTDEDRWQWLTEVSQASMEKSLQDKNHISVVSCSILKKVYRQHIKKAACDSKKFRFRFIFLYTTFEELMTRVSNRKGHYMKSDMVKSQYEIMEIPQGLELIDASGDSLAVDTSGKSPNEICRDILDNLDI